MRANGSANSCLRVLVANEPRSYREAIAAALAMLRPLDEVVEVNPASLDSEVRRLSPHLVICSRLTPIVETGASSWVELYPGGASRAVTSLGGERTTLPEMNLEQLMAFAERIWRSEGVRAPPKGT